MIDTTRTELRKMPGAVAPCMLYVLLAGVAVGVVSPLSLLQFLTRGMAAVTLLLLPAGLGVFLLPASLRACLPRGWRLLTGSGLGIGGAALLALALGECGVLGREVWIGVGVVCAAAATAAVLREKRMGAGRAPVDSKPSASDERFARASSSPGHGPSASSRPSGSDRACGDGGSSDRVGRILLWSTLPFLVIALIAAAHAPGYLWSEEGFGYDVLEYHLQMPKEYFLHGRIRYAPHNVYASFPQNVEMLYLLGMVLHGDVIAGAETAHYIHLLLGALTVGAAWLAGREFSAESGRLAAVLTATTGWLVYFCGLAYVENGMLLFGFLSLACLLRATREERLPDENEPLTPAARRSLLALAGVFAGFACGCKYTAVAMIVIPLLAGTLMLSAGSWRRRAQATVLVAAAAFATFSPWLIRNSLTTGNPVFPLANGVFRAFPPGWSEDSQRRWDEGHLPAPAERPLVARLQMLGQRVLADPDQRINPAVWLLGLFALAGGTLDRRRSALGTFLLIQILCWLLATHLYARFAVVFLIPGIPLASSTIARAASRARLLIRGIAAVGVVASAAFVYRFSNREFLSFRQPGLARWIAQGELPGFEIMRALRALPADARVLMIGDAKALYCPGNVDYAVVFNTNPLGELARCGLSPVEVLDEVHARGWTNLLVHYPEMERLRRSRYGFDEAVTAEYIRRLEVAGLDVVGSSDPAGEGKPRIVLFRIP